MKMSTNPADEPNNQDLIEDPLKPKSFWSRIEALVLIPNLALVAFVVLFLISTQQEEQVTPLVEGNIKTKNRIAELELAIKSNPSHIAHALELARLYQEVGEFPWSYSALKNAEEKGSKEPGWRFKLGLAYLELGKNKDAVRVLEKEHKKCEHSPCSVNVKVKLRLFTRVAKLFLERKIDSRKHHSAAEKALHEVLKPVEVDPDKMRPKAPTIPDPSSTPPKSNDSRS